MPQRIPSLDVLLIAFTLHTISIQRIAQQGKKSSIKCRKKSFFFRNFGCPYANAITEDYYTAVKTLDTLPMVFNIHIFRLQNPLTPAFDKMLFF